MKTLILSIIFILAGCSSSSFYEKKDYAQACSLDAESEEYTEYCLPVNSYKNETMINVMAPWELRSTKPMPD